MRGLGWGLFLLGFVAVTAVLVLFINGNVVAALWSVGLTGFLFSVSMPLLFSAHMAEVHAEFMATLEADPAALRKNDYVTIGKNPLTWRIVRIFGDQALLESGQSNRGRVEPLSALVLHTRFEE